jgi:hypothetical protein
MITNAILGPWTSIVAKARHRHRAIDGRIAPPSDLSELVLHSARSDIGSGEAVRNNHGPDVERWGRGLVGIAHCSAFVAYHLEESVAALKRTGGPRYIDLEDLFEHPLWPKWRLVAKRFWSEVGKLGYHVNQPLPGDFALFERGRDGDWKGHVEIVDAVTLGSDRFTGVAANLGAFPAKVKRVPRRLGRDRLIGFVRL